LPATISSAVSSGMPTEADGRGMALARGELADSVSAACGLDEALLSPGVICGRGDKNAMRRSSRQPPIANILQRELNSCICEFVHINDTARSGNCMVGVKSEDYR